MTHADIIRKLGGNTYVGQRLGLHRTTVSRWAIVGIPDASYLSFVALANARGMRLTIAQLAASHPRYGKQAVDAVQLLPEQSEPRTSEKTKKGRNTFGQMTKALQQAS
jgi:hypothetical protein